MKRIALVLTSITLAAALNVSLEASQDLPPVTEDGLHLERQTAHGVLYVKPGATLKPYKRVMLVDAYVAFKKDWQADYNRSRMGVTDIITAKDMERIKSDVASEFKRVFTESLQAGGYEVVAESGPDVMILRPAIVNLEVAAPDTSKPGMTAVIVSSAGSLTLYAELYDSVTSDKFAQVLDRQRAGDRGFGYRANRITNRQALDETLRGWAGRLVDRLDEAHEQSASPE